MYIILHREDKARIKLPRDMEDAKGLGRALSNYNDEYFTQVLLGFVIIYILYPFGVACLSMKGTNRDLFINFTCNVYLNLLHLLTCVVPKIIHISPMEWIFSQDPTPPLWKFQLLN